MSPSYHGQVELHPRELPNQCFRVYVYPCCHSADSEAIAAFVSVMQVIRTYYGHKNHNDSRVLLFVYFVSSLVFLEMVFREKPVS